MRNSSQSGISMYSKARQTLFGLLGLLMLLPGSAFAWGETGHRVVCQIAYEELLPEARQELDRLMRVAFDYETFAESCLFADTPERIRWKDHFVNIPRSMRAITTLDCPLDETCVLPAIRNDFLVLLDPESTDEEKWLAIKLLGHWVGDVHQPMHVSFQDDRGANSNVIETVDFDVDFEDLNLHGVWDYTIIAHNYGDDYEAISESFRAAITSEQKEAWRFDSPIEWANESYQITSSPAAKYCVWQQGACWYTKDNMLLDTNEPWHTLSIDVAYLERHAETVKKRIQQAGIRLAQLLNQSLITE